MALPPLVMVQKFTSLTMRSTISALALVLGLALSQQVDAAASSLTFEQKSANHDYGQWIVTLPDGSETTISQKVP